MTTFTATMTQPTDKIIDFALYLWWTETINQPIQREENNEILNEIENVPNPISAEEFIAEEFKKHAWKFITSYAQSRVEASLVIKRQQLEEQIIKPLQDAVVMQIS